MASVTRDSAEKKASAVRLLPTLMRELGLQRKDHGSLDVVLLTSVHDLNDGRLFRHVWHLSQSGLTISLVGFGEKWSPTPTGVGVISLGRRRTINRLLLTLFGPLCVGKSILMVVDPELAPAASFRSAVFRRPWILDVHENYRTVSRRWNQSFIGHLLHKLALKIFFKTGASASAVVAADDLPVPGRVKPDLVVRNIPQLDMFDSFKECDADLPEKNNTESFQMVYVGDVTKQRGLYDAIQAIERGSVAELHLVGEIHDSRILRMELSRTFLHGRKSYVASWLFASSFECGLLPLPATPQYATVIPSKLYEMAVVGLPILVRSETRAANLVVSNGFGFEYASGDDLLKILERLRSDEELRSATSKQALAWARTLNTNGKVSLADVVRSV